MKKIVVTNYKNFGEILENKTLVIMGEEGMEAQDGYHTFGELYDHRIALFIQICKMVLDKDRYANIAPVNQRKVWRSKLHADGSNYDGWFILGINEKPGDQISYHLPLRKWEETNFAQEYKNAPVWDGHTSDDVLKRLQTL